VRRRIGGQKLYGSLPEPLISEDNAAAHPLTMSGTANIRNVNFMM